LPYLEYSSSFFSTVCQPVPHLFARTSPLLIHAESGYPFFFAMSFASFFASLSFFSLSPQIFSTHFSLLGALPQPTRLFSLCGFFPGHPPLCSFFGNPPLSSYWPTGCQPFLRFPPLVGVLQSLFPRHDSTQCRRVKGRSQLCTPPFFYPFTRCLP